MDNRIFFEFGVYYLPTPTKDPIGETDALLKRKFSSFRKVEKITSETKEMAVAVRLLNDVGKSCAPPGLDLLRHFGRGISREQAEAIQSSKAAVSLTFAYTREHLWDGMRAALGLACSLARTTGGVLWDEETREMFTPDEWDKRRIRGWTEKIPDISKHTVIHAYSTGEYVRAITLGMAKFGLPDIVVDRFSWSLHRHMGEVMILVGQAMAEGATVKKDGEFDLDLRAIQNTTVREPQVKSLKPTATSVALLSLKQGRWEDGDPRNRLIEITFDRYPGPDVHSQQQKMLGSLFGWEDSMTRTTHDEELLEASRRARVRLPALRKAFNAGLAPGEFIHVKAKFVAPDGENEWMWVEVTSWKDNKIVGLLSSEPFLIPSLHGGQIVDVCEGDVFDYIHKRADGTTEGNETGKIIEKRKGTMKDRKE
jgi:uncharacterized protein YegJ (DUF2314 family)